MSYSIQVYTNSEYIEKTVVYVDEIWERYELEYGGSGLNLTGFYGKASFTAYPADGCKFTRWVYRLGNTQGTQRTSTANPFIHDSEENIYIRAEGEPDSSTPLSWNVSATYDFGSITKASSKSATLNPGGVYRCSVVFQKSGEATFYTSGSSDTVGYLSTSTSFNSASGSPSSSLKYNDDANGSTNCSIKYNVTAGTRYYFWVRLYDIEDSGSTTIHITPPGAGESVIPKWDWFESNGIASAMTTITAYNASAAGGSCSDFSYTVWNDMCNKVKDILDYTGESWNTNFDTFANTKMSSSDKTLTAKRFNSLRYNIGLRSSTGISTVSKGDIVYGQYFRTLADSINSWIDSL